MPNWIAFIGDRIVVTFFVGFSKSGMFLLKISQFKPKVDMSPRIKKLKGLNI